jgi:hypothetical protein
MPEMAAYGLILNAMAFYFVILSEIKGLLSE